MKNVMVVWLIENTWGENMTNEEMNRYVAEKLGLCCHERDPDGLIINTKAKCLHCDKKLPIKFTEMGYEFFNPNFTTDAGKVELLRLMVEREDYMKFVKFMESKLYGDWVAELFHYITDKTGKLLKAAYDWFKEKEK